MSIGVGTYRGRARADTADWIEVGNGEALSVELDILDRGSVLGQMRTRFKFDSEKSTKYSTKKLRALGVRGPDPFALEGLGSREADVEVERVSYQGREFMAVNVKVASGAAALDDERKAALRERLRAVAAEVPDLPPEEAPDATNNAGVETDESIPF